MSNLRQPKIRSLSVKYSSGHRVEQHSHTWAQLLYASEGVMTVKTNQTQWILPARRAIWIPGNEPHSLIMHGRVWLQTIYIKQDLSNTGLAHCTVVSIPGLLQELIKHICEQGIVSSDDTEQRVLIQFFLFQLQKLKTEPLFIPLPEDVRARKLANLLFQSPSSHKSLNSLAAECGTSLRTLQRIFKQETSLSISHWRNRVRMFHALQMLGKDQSTTHIAFELGYESVSAFIYAFRTFFGKPPQAYIADKDVF